MLIFLEARHSFSLLYCTIYRKKRELSRILSNMHAYVIVRGSVTNIRNMVDEKGPEAIYFHCSKLFSLR